MRQATLLVVLLLAAGCGPSCPRARAWRQGLRPDLVAAGRRIVFSKNVIAQINESPPMLVARIEGKEAAPVKMIVLNADGTAALTLDAKPDKDGSYWLELSLPGRKPLPAGIYRLRAELPEVVEASFEARHCVLYY